MVISDEAGQLEGKRVFYDLHTLSQFSMLLIANDEETVLAGADERSTDRIWGCEHIRFGRYGTAELTAILVEGAVLLERTRD